jgi:hypothetical protein
MLYHSRRTTALATVVLALALTGCGGDGTPADDDTTQTSSSAPASTSPSKPPKKSASPAQPALPTLAVTVSGSDVSPMAETLELEAGDRLLVTVKSDRPGELHVHSSPEQYVEFGAGKTRKTLTLAQPGQVDVEEHETGALVARLLVK